MKENDVRKTIIGVILKKNDVRKTIVGVILKKNDVRKTIVGGECISYANSSGETEVSTVKLIQQ